MVNIGRIINIIILTLAVYSIYLKLISKFGKGNILREIWIFLCGTISFFDVFVLKFLQPGKLFAVLNKLHLIAIAAAVVLIIMDFSYITKMRNQLKYVCQL